jgi:predicted nucleic acid-binding protein
MIVADVNVIIYLMTTAPLTAKAQRLAQIDQQWAVPRLWRYEFANSMATLIKAGKFMPEQGEELITQALASFEPNEFEVDQVEALRAAIKYRISPYDANYVVLAEHLDVRCVTADALVLERVRGRTIALSDIDQL